jgi:hypothetical protein
LNCTLNTRRYDDDSAALVRAQTACSLRADVLLRYLMAVLELAGESGGGQQQNNHHQHHRHHHHPFANGFYLFADRLQCEWFLFVCRSFAVRMVFICLQIFCSANGFYLFADRLQCKWFLFVCRSFGDGEAARHVTPARATAHHC